MWPMLKSCCGTWPPKGRKRHDRRPAGSYLAVDPVPGRHLPAVASVPTQCRRCAVQIVVRRIVEIPAALFGPGAGGGPAFPSVSGVVAAILPGDPARGGALFGTGAASGGPAACKLRHRAVIV